MAKSRTVFRRLKGAPAATRALIKKTNQRHVAQLVKAAQMNRRITKPLAALVDFKPEHIPDAARKRLTAETVHAMRLVTGRVPREPRR